MGGLARGVGAFRRWIVMLRHRVVVLRRRVAVLRRAQLARKRRGTREELKTPSPPAPGVSKDLPAIESSAPSAPPEDSMLDAPSEKEKAEADALAKKWAKKLDIPLEIETLNEYSIQLQEEPIEF